MSHVVSPEKRQPLSAAAAVLIDLSSSSSTDQEIESTDDDRKPAAKTTFPKKKEKAAAASLMIDLTTDDDRSAPLLGVPSVASLPPAAHSHHSHSDEGYTTLDEQSENDDHAFALQLQREFDAKQKKKETSIKVTTTNSIVATSMKDDPDQALARQLQEQYDKEQRDEQLAQQLQAQLHQQGKAPNEQETELQDDEELARKLQEQLHQQDKAKEEEQMVSNVTGKAWKFVEKVLELHKQLQNKTTDQSLSQINAVAVDDMVFLAEALLKTQEIFRQVGKPVHVDIGYHYTKRENMTRIKTDGLLTKSERDANGINSQYNGSVYGDGVYTGSDPFTFLSYGDVGLIVARLQGTVGPRCTRGPWGGAESTCDTVTGPGMLVLGKSSQCLALIEYSTSILHGTRSNSAGSQVVQTYYFELQKIVDQFFNGGRKTEVPKHAPYPVVPGFPPGISIPAGSLSSLPASVRATLSAMPVPASALAAATAAPWIPQAVGGIGMPGMSLAPIGRIPPQAYNSVSSRKRSRPTAIVGVGGLNETIRYNAPAVLHRHTDLNQVVQDVLSRSASDEDCAICLMSLRGRKKVVRLKSCGHEFHYSCVENAVQHSKNCPVCRKALGKPQGKMPSGMMTISQTPSVTCAGFPPGCITIQYSITRGMQKTYHPSPGTMHASTHRIAYLPDNDQGRKLLKRLKFAFQHGLSFSVGTSLTTGMPNQVTWSSIHHKTSPSGGSVHGFPDPNYISNCNQELDALNVPSADAL